MRGFFMNGIEVWNNFLENIKNEITNVSLILGLMKKILNFILLKMMY